MKKYITIAALLAAGSAFANANPVKDPIGDLTLTTPEGNKLESGNSPINWSNEGVGSLTSWELSFTLNIAREGINANTPLFGTDGSGSAGGYILEVNNDGSVELWKSGIGTISVGANVKVNTDENITLKFVADWDTVQKTYTGGTFTLTTTEETKTLDVDNYTADTKLLKNSNSRLWTNSGAKNPTYTGAEKFSAITVKQLADNVVIPEPSAFGLLAGIGALALVASRRRRK